MTNDIIDNTIDLINQSSKNAQKKSLENGVPNVYSKNGVIYYQLPDGTITMDDPFVKGELKQKLDELTKEGE